MKKRSRFIPIALLPILMLIIAASYSEQQNWPQFRGAESNLVSNSLNLPEKWANDTNVVWTYQINGNGFSSPVIWENKVIILSVFPEKVKEQPKLPDGPPPGNGAKPDTTQKPRQDRPPGLNPNAKDTSFKQDIYRWEVTCIELNSGKELWKRVAFKGNPRIAKHAATSYAPETPIIDGKRVYAYFGMLGLFCYDLNGNLLWQKDLGAYETQKDWGTGSSPILYQDMLYVQVDNEEKSFLAAIDAATGNEKWRVVRNEKTNYSTPIIWKNSVKTELIVGGKTACSYDLKTGKLNWELKIGGDQSLPSPVADKSLLYIGNNGMRDKGNFFAVKAGAEGDITPKDSTNLGNWIAWSAPKSGLGNASPVLYKGLIYNVANRNGEITCIDAKTGKLVYKNKISGVGAVWASTWAYNDKIFFVDEKGITYVLKAGEKFEQLYTNKLNDKFWASVAIAGNSLIFRGSDKVFRIKK